MGDFRDALEQVMILFCIIAAILVPAITVVKVIHG